MRLYIIQDIDYLTNHLYSGGSLVVVAANWDAVLELIDKENIRNRGRVSGGMTNIHLEKHDMETAIMHEIHGEAEERLFVFPNAGGE